MSKTQFTLSEASRVTGRSRTTLRSYLKNGKLSSVLGHGDQRLIDGVELCRVFGNDLDFELADPAVKRATASGASKVANDGQSALAQLELVKQQLEREIDNARRDREHYEKQLEELHSALKRTQEGHERAMRLIEDRSRASKEWEQPLKRLESQVASRDTEHRKYKKKAGRAISILQQQLEAERSKTLWQRLFRRPDHAVGNTDSASHASQRGGVGQGTK